MIPRAYSLLRIKAVNDETRRITGVASTPEPDRMGDIVEPLGITFAERVPLLLYHRTAEPVGWVTFDPPTADGLTFEAELPIVTDPGTVRDRVEEAWVSLKTGLLAGVSIGFRSTVKEVFNKATGGFRFPKTEVLELSLVTIPANAAASIHTVKMLDTASTETPPMIQTKTIADQIADTDTARTLAVRRMTEIMTAAGENTLDGAAATEYDDCRTRVETWDAHLGRLRALEQTQLPAATRLEATTERRAASEARGGISTRVVTVTSQHEKGSGFIRAICARVACKGNNADAVEYARQRYPNQPEIAAYLKAAVAPGTTTDPAWAGPLAQPTVLQNEFIELLRPATILGRIPALKRVPFNVSLPKQTLGGSYKWVGQTKPKPISSLGFGTVTLGFSKAAGILVISEELARLSNPSAEALVRADMVAGIAAFLDLQFIDPAVAAVANVSPASITNGAPTSASTGAGADLMNIMSSLSAANMPLGNATVILSETNALALSFAKNTDGSQKFPGMTARGGSISGINFVASNAAGTNVIGLSPERILLAEGGGIEIDLSREASVQMDSAPMDPADATTVYTSLWQNNLIGLRAEQFINWLRLDTAAVKYVTAANYPSTITPFDAGGPAAREPNGREKH